MRHWLNSGTGLEPRKSLAGMAGASPSLALGTGLQVPVLTTPAVPWGWSGPLLEARLTPHPPATSSASL